MDKKLSEKFKWLSLFMTLAIVCYHVAPHFLRIFMEPYDSLSKLVLNFYDTFGQLALTFFFAQSAYFFASNNSISALKLKKRLKTLLIPYVIWNLLYLLFFLIIDRESIIKEGVIGVILGFTLDPFDGPLWYIPVLFLYLIIFSCIEGLLKQSKNSKFVLAVTLFLIIVSSLFRNLIVSKTMSFTFDYWVERFIRFIPAFMFGACFTQCLEKSNNAHRTVQIIVFSVTLCGAVWLGDSGVTIVLLYISALALWNTISKEDIKEYKVDKYINTFIIYAIHDALIRVMLALTYKTGMDQITIPSVVVVILPPIITGFIIGVSIIVTIVIRKIEPVRKVLTGGR